MPRRRKFRPILAAIATALVINLMSPPIGWGFLAPLVLAPLFLLWDESMKTRLLGGWLAGFLLQAAGYYWIFFTIRDFGGLSAGIGLAGGILFWLYQGLDLAIWLGLTPLVCKSLPAWAKPLAAAGTWLLIQVSFPYVFPWSLGALSASPALFSQPAALWTQDGLSFLAALLTSALCLPGTMAKLRYRLGYGLAVSLAWGCGFLFVHQAPSTRSIKVAVIQPNLIPWAKQGQLSVEELFQAHVQPTLQVAQEQPDLVLWPETALPFELAKSPHYLNELKNLASRLNFPLIFGTLGTLPDGKTTNEIWMIAPDQSIQTYQKHHLVWFSESVPFIFSWATYFDPGMGSFGPGPGLKSFDYVNHKSQSPMQMQIIPLVCMEGMLPAYPHGTGGQLMVNLTNDAWFGKSKASSQHLQHIRTRSVELGIPLVRATNSGISCWIDAQGAIHGSTPLYQRAQPIYQVPVTATSTSAAISHKALIAIRISAWLLLGWGLSANILDRKKMSG